MINSLAAAKGMNSNDAYMLISIDGDVEMTELIDRNMAVHVVIPKAPFTMR